MASARTTAESPTALADPPRLPAAESRVRRLGAAWLPPVLAGLATLLLWELAVRVLAVESYILPPPSDVLAELWDQRAPLLEASWVTTQEIVAGFALAIVFSVPVAVVIVASRPLERALYPLLVLSQNVPKIAVAPLFVIWFGFSSLPKILTAFLICFFPIVIDTIVGLRSVSTESVDLLRSMGASRRRTFLELRLPASLPYMFSGFKVSVTLAVVGAIVGEFVASDQGLGYEIINANSNLNTELLFAAVTALTLIGLVLFYIVEALERMLVPWHASQRGSGAAGTP